MNGSESSGDTRGPTSRLTKASRRKLDFFEAKGHLVPGLPAQLSGQPAGRATPPDHGSRNRIVSESDPEPQRGDRSSGVLSDDAFRRLLALEASRAIRYQDFFSLCLIRPDQLNPEDRGNETLAQIVARKIAEFVRSSDVVGRLAEGIGVLLLHAASGDALRVAERLRSQITNVRFH